MTKEEALKILTYVYENEVEKGGRGCDKTAFRTALLMSINALTIIDQIRWERDVVIEQLEDIGVGLGRKMDGKYLSKEEYEELLEYKYIYEDLKN